MGSLKSSALILLSLLLIPLSISKVKADPKAENFFKPGSITVQKVISDTQITRKDQPVKNLYKPGSFLVVAKGANAGDSLKDSDLDDYDTQSVKTEVYDPFEGWNRFWFKFNDKFFIYVAKPVYRGWEYITPHQLRTGLKNFFHNLLFPVRFINNLLQFRLKGAGVEFSRFMMNTMCSAGFANPAKNKKTIVPMDEAGEDFGQTLGVWGFGHGPYLVWPFIGPSSVRETFGRIGDLFADPIFYLQPWYASTATGLTLRFNDLDEVLPLYDDLVGAAIDPYISMREAYINYRNFHVQK